MYVQRTGLNAYTITIDWRFPQPIEAQRETDVLVEIIARDKEDAIAIAAAIIWKPGSVIDTITITHEQTLEDAQANRGMSKSGFLKAVQRAKAKLGAK